jgi:hypothetical protein
MMDDLISRQAAIDEIDEWIKAFRENGHKESAADACLIQDGIIQLPSAESERKTGKWIDYSDEGYVECPFCHSATNCDGNKDELHYCFSCGTELR